MEPFEQLLSAELTALRPTPTPEFAAELDERAAAGFSRRADESPWSRLLEWLGSAQPRRALIPVGATALAAVAAVTVVVAVGHDSGSPSLSGSPAPEHGARPDWSGVQFEAPPPSKGTSAAPERSASDDSSGIDYRSVPPVAGPKASSHGSAAIGGSSSSGPYASNAGHRQIERSAEITLGADPEQVGEDAAEVFDAVHAADGIVLSSSVSGGPAGDAGARFELLIPAAKLSDALASFSAIDTVLARHEATDDITAPTVRAGELLRDSRAKIDGLLTQLAGSETEAERVAAEAELRAERRHNAQLRSRLSGLERRANLSRVSLRIETESGLDSGGAGGWGVGDAFHDAGHILGIAAGIVLVGLAVLAPIALLALLAWLATRAWIRRARQRTLD